MTFRARLWLPVLFVVVIAACGDDSGPTGSGDDGGDPGPGQNNRAPVASFTADPTQVPAGDNHQTVVTLDGSASSDPDGDPLTYSWTAPSGLFVNGTDSNDQITMVTFPGTAPYVVRLVVRDGNGGQDTAQFTVGLN